MMNAIILSDRQKSNLTVNVILVKEILSPKESIKANVIANNKKRKNREITKSYKKQEII